MPGRTASAGLILFRKTTAGYDEIYTSGHKG